MPADPVAAGCWLAERVQAVATRAKKEIVPKRFTEARLACRWVP